MKILHILDHSIPLHSGYTFRTRAILEQQKALGWKTYHLTGPKHNQVAKPESRVEVIDDLKFYRSDELNSTWYNLPIINQLAVVKSLQKRLDEIIPEIKPDIIHSHSPALNGLAAVKAGKKYNIPVVYEIRAFWEDAAVDHGTSKEWGLRYRITRALETYVIKNAQAVTTICEGLRKDIVERGVAESKVTVIPNAVDLDKFSGDTTKDEALAESLGLKNAMVLGFIGSFYAYEGLPLLIEALPEIISKQKNIKLLLVGGGPDEQKLKQKIDELGLNDKVIFTGRVPHEKVQAYYNLVDIFIYPRYPMRLTELVTPLKPLEAMAQNRLVVASDVGGHKELINDGQNGKLFQAGNSSALAKAVLSLTENKDQWQSYHQAGKKYVQEERNWPTSVACYKPVYESLISVHP